MLYINVWERLRGLMTDGSGGLEGSGEGWAQAGLCVCAYVCALGCVHLCVYVCACVRMCVCSESQNSMARSMCSRNNN